MLYSPSRGLWQPSRELLANLTLDQWERGLRPWHQDPRWRPGRAWCPGLDTERRMHALGVIFPGPASVRRDVIEKAPAGGGGGSLSASLVAFWELEEASGNRLDATANGYTLAPTGTPANAAAIVGNGIVFASASSQELTHASNSDLQISTDKTFVWWAKLVSKSVQNVFFCKGLIGTSTGEYVIQARDGGGVGTDYIEVRHTNSSSAFSTVHGGADLDTNWHFFVVTWDSVGHTTKIWMDNSAENGGTANNVPRVGTATFEMGADSGIGSFSNDKMDQAGIWNRILTSSEQTYLYQSGSGRSYADVSTASP